MTSPSHSELDKAADRPFHRELPATPPTINSPEATTAVISAEQINRLFHDPAPPPSAICPLRFSGSDPESTNTLIRTLAHNHLSWHIFFNFKRFQNHAAHHLLCIWAMGASSRLLGDVYASHYEFQRPAFESPEPITRENYREHLGKEDFYSAFLAFFKSELLEKGLSECLEEYVLSLAANYHDRKQPGMLSRLMTVIFHALIHVGYGAEFGLLGLSAEGLAMAATHPANLKLMNRAWFSNALSETDQKGGTQNAITLLSLVACDARFDNIKPIEVPTLLRSVLEEYGPAIREYVEMWKFDATTDTGIATAIEELSWVNTMIYGVGGHLPRSQKFRADFLLVHLLTSSLFLPSLLANISQFSSRRAFLLTYFTASLASYIGRGRPALDLRAFYNRTEHLLHQVPLSSPPAPVPGAFPILSSDSPQTSNAWLPLIQSALVSPNTHLCKLHRALAHYSCLYGKHRKGWANGEGAEDPVGLGELDGTLFLRVAMLTQNRLGWKRGGDPEQHWDFDGFFEPDESVQNDVNVPRPASSALLSLAQSFHLFAHTATHVYLISLAPLLVSTFDLFYHTSRQLLLGYQTLLNPRT